MTSENTIATSVMLANFEPFRLVLRPEDAWQPTIRDLNARNYDYVKLHRLSMFIDDIAPFWLGIAFDGTLVLPVSQDMLAKEQTLPIFNKALCAALLGGVFCESVGPLDLVPGLATAEGYTKAIAPPLGAVASFHYAIRTKHVGQHDVIRLLNPPTMSIKDFSGAVRAGLGILERVRGLSPELVLAGTTFLVRHQWAEALIHLWACTEQVISRMWVDRVVAPSSAAEPQIDGRISFLKDQRTWTASVRSELLFQRGVIDAETYALMARVRKCRNRFVHDGVTPDADSTRGAARVLFRLMSCVATGYQDVERLDPVLTTMLSHQRPNLVEPRSSLSMENAVAVLRLPPVPGDPTWGDKEYEVVRAVCLEVYEDSDA